MSAVSLVTYKVCLRSFTCVPGAGFVSWCNPLWFSVLNFDLPFGCSVVARAWFNLQMGGTISSTYVLCYYVEFWADRSYGVAGDLHQLALWHCEGAENYLSSLAPEGALGHCPWDLYRLKVRELLFPAPSLLCPWVLSDVFGIGTESWGASFACMEVKQAAGKHYCTLLPSQPATF